MKNKYKIFTIIFLIFFFKISNLYSDEFKFESSEIQILDNGNLLKAKNGVKIISDDGVIINADKVEYNKKSYSKWYQQLSSYENGIIFHDELF